MAYKAIHETFWTDPDAKAKLKPLERYLFSYFITCPTSHFSGLYYILYSTIKEETKLADRDIDRGIDTLIKEGFIKYDVVRNIVFVVKMLKYQIKDAKLNDKQKQGVINHFSKLHNTPLIIDFLNEWKDLNLNYEIKTDTPIDRGIDTHPYTVNDIYTDTDKDSLGKSENPFLEIPFKEILKDLEEKTGKKYKPTKDIKELISGRWCDGFGLEDFKQVHTNMAAKWLGDPEWDRFLQPSTLYRKTKFQGYLNAKPTLSDTGKVSKVTQKNLKVFENFKTGEKDAERTEI